MYEPPAEHLRNAEQLLHELLEHGLADVEPDELVRAALRRVETARRQLEEGATR